MAATDKTGSGSQSGSDTASTQMKQFVAAMSGANVPTETRTTYLTQTSQPDITALVNSVMQQLVGRNATADEIATYGSELLAAERANTGSYAGQTSYQEGINRKASVIGTQTQTGIDPAAFLTTLIQGTADAKSYRAATQYFDGMTQALQNMKAI